MPTTTVKSKTQKIRFYINKLKELQSFLEKSYVAPADRLFDQLDRLEERPDNSLDKMQINTYWTKPKVKANPV